MKDDIKIIGSILVIILIVFGIIIAISKPPQQSVSTTLSTEQLAQTLVKSDSFTSGPQDAKATLVEFGDMQCPACASFHPTIKQIREKYKDKLRYVFRHYPLPQHPQAIPGARAVVAAQAQGAFDTMQDMIFSNQSEWTTQKDPFVSFKKYAQDLKLDLVKFEKDYNDPTVASKINQDTADGNTVNVNSTPSFFFNGKKYEGDYSMASFQKEIDAMLK